MPDYSDRIMTYEEGVEFMKSLTTSDGITENFQYGKFTISYPGYKKRGDYKLTYTNSEDAPKHTDVVDMLQALCTVQNRDQIVTDLEQIFHSGLNAKTVAIDNHLKNKIFWITLQEEINYPPPRYLGKRLPLQRFFEATLLCLNMITKEQLHDRTNNHGGGVPKLLILGTLSLPSFYVL